jgi:hypothetical protein
MKTSVRRWRIIPKVRLINYHTNFPKHMRGGLWERWFYFERRWGGRIWYFGVRHLALELDFRRDWLYDMAHPEFTTWPTLNALLTERASNEIHRNRKGKQ